MSKNIIYILDCRFNDEWHLKDIARKRILENRGELTDSHINSIFDSSWPQQNQEEWTSITIPRIQKYAGATQSDFYCFTEDWLKEMPMPSSFHKYQRAVFLKFLILKEFEKSEYERMLFLDLDILITNYEKNIFTELPSSGLYMGADHNAQGTRSCKRKLLEFFNLKVDLIPLSATTSHINNFDNPPPLWFDKHAFYNWGVILGDKDSISQLNSIVPDNDKWVDFFKLHGLSSNPHDSFFNKELLEQDMLIYFLQHLDLKIKCLPRCWNFEHLYIREKNSVNFVHMYDKHLIKYFDKKYKLRSLSTLYNQFQFNE